MEHEFLDDRRNALEDQFFAKHNEKLLEQMRAKKATQAKKESLAAASGINDEKLLEHLVELDINGETLAALALIPLVEVAWADRRIEEEERQAVLASAAQAGLDKGTTAYHLLEGWLVHRPSGALVSAWKEYVGVLTQAMSTEEREKLRQDILGRARDVAEATGGFLGLGNKISETERAVLEEMDQAFQH